MTAEPSTERSPSDEPLTWMVTEYADHDPDTLTIVGSKYQVERGGEVICTGISDQKLAEDIAALPILKRELERLSGLVPVQRSEDNRLESVCQLLEELLAEVRRGNSLERTGSVSSVEIQDNPTKDLKVRINSKTYAGSPLPVDEALADHARLHREAEERAMNGWAVTLASVRNEAAS